jgi:hypothetical protein
MHLGHYLKVLDHAQHTLTTAFREVAEAHADEPDVRIDSEKFAARLEQHAIQLTRARRQYGEDAAQEPERLLSSLFDGPRTGPLGLLRDLHDLYLLATECDISSTLIAQAAQGARDAQLAEIAADYQRDVTVQLAWLRSRLKQAAPQALVVAS